MFQGNGVVLYQHPVTLTESATNGCKGVCFTASEKCTALPAKSTHASVNQLSIASVHSGTFLLHLQGNDSRFNDMGIRNNG